MPEAGTVRAAADSGCVKLLVFGLDVAYDCERKSNILRVPSAEHVARMSGWCGEKRAW